MGSRGLAVTLLVIGVAAGGCGSPTNEEATATTMEVTTTSTASTTTSTEATTTSRQTTTTMAPTTSAPAESHKPLASAPVSEFPLFIQEHSDDIKAVADQVGLPPVAPLHPLERFDWSIDAESFGTLPGAYSYYLHATADDPTIEYDINLRVAPKPEGGEGELEADGWIKEEEASPAEGFSVYWYGMGEQIEFMLMPAEMDFTVTLGVSRTCPGEPGEPEFDPGICMTWEDVRAAFHGLGVIE